MTSPPPAGGTPDEGELRLPPELCPPLPPGWVVLDQWDRLVLHARPSSQGRPSVEVWLDADGTLQVSATTAREASYERVALLALRRELIERTAALSAYLRQRQWLRARLRGEEPPPDPLAADPAAFGDAAAARDLWARAMLRLALSPPPGVAPAGLLRRAIALGTAETRALAVTVAIVSGDLAPVQPLLRDAVVDACGHPWLDAVLGCWLGDFARTDSALRRWIDGDHPRRVEIAAQIYAEAGAASAASALARRAIAELPPGDPRALNLLSFVDPQLPIPDLAARVAAAVPADAVQLASLADTLLRREDLDLAQRLYARGVERWPDSVALLGELAELQLWSGDYDAAAGSIDRLARLAPARAAVLDAVRRLATGALDEADRTLRALPRTARPGPLYALLEAELLVRRGRYRRARRLLNEANGTQALVAGRLLGAMCAIRCGDSAHAVSGEDDEIGWARRGELAALTPAEPADVPRDAEALYARLERALANLRGNRSHTPTVALSGAARRVAPPPDMRERAVAVLFGIVHRSPEQVLEDFAALLATHRGSAHPHCYRGELLLWLGRYDEAERDFAAARDISPLRRWAYVGLAAVALMRDRPRDTLAIAATCEKMCGANDAATLGVYAGEAHRRLGHRWRARRALDAVIAAKPSRLGARINRALLERGVSGAARRADTWQQVCRIVPGLAAAARAAHMDDADLVARLETCLSRMLGNRSSTIISYLDSDERFRVRPMRVEHLAELTGALHRECLSDLFKA